MERMWHYVVGGTDKAGPVSENELRGLIAEGRVQPGDLVWTEGMADWQPASAMPELMGGGPAAGPAAAPVMASPSALYRGGRVPEGLGGWMGFVGVMNIINGALTCLSCIGALIGIPMIIAGASLVSAKNFLINVTDVSPDMANALEKIKRFMVITGIIYIIGLIGMVLYIVFIVMMMMGGGLAAMGNM